MRLAAIVLVGACGCHSTPEQPSELTFAPATLPDAIAGQPYAATIVIANNVTPVYRVTSTELPAGLTFEPELNVRGSAADGPHAAATIRGTPTQAGATTLTIDASCYGTNAAGQVGKHSYTLVVR